MPDRAQILDSIDRAYEARARGDKEAVAPIWAAGATYRLCGEASLIPSFPAGPAAAGETVESIIDLIHFHSHERLEAVVEGNRAAIRWRVEFSVQDGPVETTDLADFWEFDDDGRAISLIQFVDTAMLGDMLRSSGR